MAKIKGVVQFAVKIEIASPIMLDKAKVEAFVARAEAALTAAISGVVNTSLRVLPGFTATLSDARTKVTVTEVEA